MFLLHSGSRTGAIHHHDVRVGTHHVGTLANHSQEVCGLRWSPDGQFLASGANDNTVNVWDATLTMEASPLHTFTEHQAAIKVSQTVVPVTRGLLVLLARASLCMCPLFSRMHETEVRNLESKCLLLTYKVYFPAIHFLS